MFDLHDVKPHEFVRYGLACLEKWANNGDRCAKETRQNMRVVVCFYQLLNLSFYAVVLECSNWYFTALV